MTITKRGIPNNFRSNEKGSSLIGVAILMLALGFIVTGAIYLMQNYETIYSDQDSVEGLREIETSLMDFVAREGRYPCPASLTLAPDQEDPVDGTVYGREGPTNCNAAGTYSGTFRAIGRGGANVRIGAIPVRSLNLPDSKMVDGYGRRYFYAITEDMASPGADVQNDLGVISIENQNGDPISDVSGHIVYALISPGPDDRGAYDEQGNLLQPCQAGTDAYNNCRFTTVTNPPATFTASSQKSFGVGANTFTHTFAFHANTIPYRWFTTPWDACGEANFSLSPPREICFSGTQYRTVECRDNRGTVVADSECSHTPKPEADRVCSLPPCRWNAGAWEICVPGVGIGTDIFNSRMIVSDEWFQLQEERLEDERRRREEEERRRQQEEEERRQREEEERRIQECLEDADDPADCE